MQGEKENCQSHNATKTGISFGCMGHLAPSRLYSLSLPSYILREKFLCFFLLSFSLNVKHRHCVLFTWMWHWRETTCIQHRFYSSENWGLSSKIFKTHRHTKTMASTWLYIVPCLMGSACTCRRCCKQSFSKPISYLVSKQNHYKVME